MTNYQINDQSILNTAISAHCSVTVLSHRAVLNNRDSGPPPALDHPVHQLPLTNEGVELQDVIIIEGGTLMTA